MKSAIKWKLKQFPNLIIRLITFDHCYICDECHKVHKRDGTEVRFDDDPKHLLYNRWWYNGVCRKCFEETMDRVARLLREETIKYIQKKAEDKANETVD